MDGPVSGDIFPARETIELVDQVDLGVPLEIPTVPPEAQPDNVPAEQHRRLLNELFRLLNGDPSGSRAEGRARRAQWFGPRTSGWLSPAERAPSRLTSLAARELGSRQRQSAFSLEEIGARSESATLVCTRIDYWGSSCRRPITRRQIFPSLKD